MKFKDETFDPNIRELHSWELYQSIHHALFNKGYHMSNGLRDLLGALSEWMELNTNQISISHSITIHPDMKISNEDAIGMSKSYCVQRIADELLKKDYFSVKKGNHEIQITFEALLVNPNGKAIRIPTYEPTKYIFTNEQNGG